MQVDRLPKLVVAYLLFFIYGALTRATDSNTATVIVSDGVLRQTIILLCGLSLGVAIMLLSKASQERAKGHSMRVHRSPGVWYMRAVAFLVASAGAFISADLVPSEIGSFLLGGLYGVAIGSAMLCLLYGRVERFTDR